MSLRIFVFVAIVIAWLALPAQPVENPRDTEIAAGKFLIASNFYMSDPKFQTSVILLVRHDPEKGTLGLILNHPTKMNVHDALPGISEAQHLTSPIYIGGPVSLRDYMMLVRTNQPGDGLLRVINNVSFSSSVDTIAEWLPRESRPNKIRIFAGYSGWAAGQLALEIQMRGWRLLPADAATVFDVEPENLWQELEKQQTPLRTSIHSGWLPQDPSLLRGAPVQGGGQNTVFEQNAYGVAKILQKCLHGEALLPVF